MVKKLIQIRVPDAMRRGVKARAAVLKMSVSDYLEQEIEEILERPTLLELRQRLHRRRPVKVQIDTAQLVRTAQREAKHDSEDFGEDL
jgi:hypothetical protein